MGTHPIFESDFDCLTEMDEETVIEQGIFDRAKMAKLDKTHLNMPSVELTFGLNIDNANQRLLELNDDLLAKIENGEQLFIRGEDEESVVLCTDKKTYDIKLCQTSNQLLIVPDTITPEKEHKSPVDVKQTEVVKRAQNYLEPKLILPRIGKLFTLLPTISVERMADSSEAKEAGLTTGQLLESIQASEAELFDALKRAYAIKVNEKWKIIKELDSIMLEISRTVTNLNLSSDSVNLTELTEVINSAEELYPSFAIRHALLQVSEQKSSTLFAIDMDKLSVQVGLVLLKKASKMHLDDFVDVWKCAVPELGEAKCEVDHILGSAYLGDEKRPTVNFLDPLTLPTDPLRLFERLFQIKKKWSEEELLALTERITPPNKKSSVLIQKYCRAVTANGKKVYTSKTISNNNYRT